MISIGYGANSSHRSRGWAKVGLLVRETFVVGRVKSQSPRQSGIRHAVRRHRSCSPPDKRFPCAPGAVGHEGQLCGTERIFAAGSTRADPGANCAQEAGVSKLRTVVVLLDERGPDQTLAIQPSAEAKLGQTERPLRVQDQMADERKGKPAKFTRQ